MCAMYGSKSTEYLLEMFADTLPACSVPIQSLHTHIYIFYNFTSNLPMKDFVSTQHDMLSLLPPGDSTCSGARRGDVGSDQEEGRRTSDERSKVTTRHGRPANEGKVDHPGMS